MLKSVMLPHPFCVFVQIMCAMSAEVYLFIKEGTNFIKTYDILHVSLCDLFFMRQPSRVGDSLDSRARMLGLEYWLEHLLKDD